MSLCALAYVRVAAHKCQPASTGANRSVAHASPMVRRCYIRDRGQARQRRRRSDRPLPLFGCQLCMAICHSFQRPLKLLHLVDPPDPTTCTGVSARITEVAQPVYAKTETGAAESSGCTARKAAGRRQAVPGGRGQHRPEYVELKEVISFT